MRGGLEDNIYIGEGGCGGGLEDNIYIYRRRIHRGKRGHSYRGQDYLTSF